MYDHPPYYLTLEHEGLTKEPDRSRAGEQAGTVIPWAADWVVLDCRLSDISGEAGASSSFLPRPNWPRETIERYEADLLQGKLAGEAYTVWSFGYTKELADELLDLVLRGRKSATCGSLPAYEADGEAPPEVGALSVILDGRGVPGAIIRSVECRVIPFGEVDEQFAYDEGEGDRSYRYWRKAHENYFREESAVLGYTLDEQLPLVCERFELVERFD